LQQNFDAVIVENDFLIKENSIDVKTDKFYAQVACSIEETELKVSFVSDDVSDYLPAFGITTLLKSEE
jgi:hypothetical protein